VSVDPATTVLARLVPRREVYWVGTTQAMEEPPQYVVIDTRSYPAAGARPPRRGPVPRYYSFNIKLMFFR